MLPSFRLPRASRLLPLLLLGLLAGGIASLPAAATPFYRNGDPDPAIPTPESVLGYEVGQAFSGHDRIVDYLERVAEASPRVDLERYGETYEGRPLLLLTISDPRNLRNKEDIRSAYARLADYRGLSEGEARGRTRDLPVAVWLSFNIHGNEASSSEAALALVYTLAASRDPQIVEMLRSTMVLVDPCLNPDGRERYVHCIRAQLGSRPDPSPAAREHHEAWPGGRYNHYLFDLNRDWAWLTQRETRARAAAYLSWRPQVHVDFHEMWADATYFFFPPERPVHEQYPPQVMRWAETFGRGNAAAFDARGWRYYTSESFDLYYPGYGDSWPTFHGAIGMTYEQAGHGFAGVELELPDGHVLTLAERAEHHYVAALATLDTASRNREARLMDFYRFFRPAGDGNGPAAYYLAPGDDPVRTAQLVSLLMDHGAEVYRSREEIRPRTLTDYDGNVVSRTLPEGTYVVPMDQPLHRFLRAILEPEAALPDTLFYDVSAWSLPLAFGVEAYTSESRAGGRMERLEAPPEVRGAVVNPGAAYAWLVSWDRNGAPRAAAWLQDRGVNLHFATREFTAGGRTFPPGSLVIFRAGNAEDLPDLLAEAAALCGVEVIGTESGYTEEGPDLGSDRVRAMRSARVAVVADEPASPTSVGPCWFLLDRLYDIPHSLVRPPQITRSMLQDYDVLVFPDDDRGGYGYASRIDSSQVRVIRDWIRDGGVFVGLGGGAFFASADLSGLSSVPVVSRDDDENGLTEEERRQREKERRLELTEEREERRRTEALPGTIFRVRVDPLHPLGFGYRDEARVLKISDAALELGPPGTNVAVFTSSPKVSGYASEEVMERLVDRPFLVDEPLGRGHVVMYVEDPNFRLFWYGLTRLFLNSIFFLPSMGSGLGGY